jgi:hypothetical protein
MHKKIAVLGAGAIGGSVEEFSGYLSAEIDKWARVIREAGIRAD